MDLTEQLLENPIIASIKNEKGMSDVIKSDCKVVFVLFGSIISIGSIVQKLKDSGKQVFVNVDLIDGLGSREVVIDFIKLYTKADGILSSKSLLVKAAKDRGFIAIHRMFLIDSFAFYNVVKLLDQSHADFMELMPGCMPETIADIKKMVTVPIIAGGLVCRKANVIGALKAGAIAISSTNEEVWEF